MRVIYTIVVALFVIFIITFSLENTDPVTLRYHGFDFFKGSLPTYMLIFISFLAGVIFTGLMGIVERFRLTRTINRLNKTIRDLRREIKANDNSNGIGTGSGALPTIADPQMPSPPISGETL